MKFTIFEGINNCMIICAEQIDANLSSCVKVLQSLPENKKHTIILSDLSFIDKAKNLENSKIRFIAIAPNDNKERATKVAFFESEDALITTISSNRLGGDNNFFKNENIVILGGAEMSKISRRLEAKSALTTFEIDLDAMAYNIDYFRNKLKPTTKTLCMLKSYSYGMGSYELACLMQIIDVDYIAVANTNEGAALRKKGIKMPIIILTPEFKNLEAMIRYKLEPVIHNFRSLDNFVEACKNMGKTNYPIHIKIETGMYRLGFIDSDIDELITRLKGLKEVKAKSIMTHLATGDEYSLAQLERFDIISTRFVKAFKYKIIRHALNSINVENFPQYQYDMVRLGIGMYGGGDFVMSKTKTVGRLKSVIVETKMVEPPNAIGYGRKGLVGDVAKRIGIITVGYSEGLPRMLGEGKISFSVNGQLAPTIGVMCMGLSMIDLDNIDAKEGDSVEIFGDSPTIFELAEAAGTISYDIIAKISRGVKRIYTITI